PGTISLRPDTLIALVRDVVQSLARHGFREIYFLNGHGGNVATVQAAFAQFHAEASFAGVDGPAPRLKSANWCAGRRVVARSRELFGDSEGSPATRSEISLTWHAYPEQARPMDMEPKIAPGGAFGDAFDYRRRFP